jgi:hypothetical protein
VPVTALAGVNLNDVVPGGTTTEAMYGDVINPIDAEATYEPEKFVGVNDAEYKPPGPVNVSIVKYDEPLGLVKANIFNPDRFSPIDPVPASCADVYVAIIC